MCSMWRTCQPAVYRMPYYILLFQVYTHRQKDRQIFTVEDMTTSGVQDAILHSTVPGIHTQIERQIDIHCGGPVPGLHSQIDRYTPCWTCQPAVYRMPYYILLSQVNTDRYIDIHCGGPVPGIHKQIDNYTLWLTYSRYTQLDRQIYTVEDMTTFGVQDAILHSTVSGIHRQIDRQITIHCGGSANQRCTGCHITFYCSRYTQIDRQIYTVEYLITSGVQDAILHSTVP